MIRADGSRPRRGSRRGNFGQRPGGRPRYGFRARDAANLAELAEKMATQAWERAGRLDVRGRVVKIGVKLWVALEKNQPFDASCKAGVGQRPVR